MEEQDKGKQSAARAAVSYVKSDMIIGLGTGSTVEFFLTELSKKIEEGLRVCGVPTSIATEKRALALGIPLCSEVGREIDIDFDGADEVDSKGNLIKGGGGALTREKIVARNSREMCVLVDESKLSPVNLGRRTLPVEILTFMHESTVRQLRKLCDSCTPREAFLTDNGHMIVDLRIAEIKDPVDLESRIKMIPGVVEVGLFVGLTSKVIVGKENGSYELTFKK